MWAIAWMPVYIPAELHWYWPADASAFSPGADAECLLLDDAPVRPTDVSDGKPAGAIACDAIVEHAIFGGSDSELSSTTLEGWASPASATLEGWTSWQYQKADSTKGAATKAAQGSKKVKGRGTGGLRHRFLLELSEGQVQKGQPVPVVAQQHCQQKRGKVAKPVANTRVSADATPQSSADAKLQ
eukprot:11334052-Karenia_brevis.AAC.1